MSVKSFLRNNRLLSPLYRWATEKTYSLITLISPTLATKILYRSVFGKKLDLSNPQTLNEKILWLKLKRYMRDPLVIQCADKYRVREYVEQCGCGDILNELIGVYDRAEDIPWEELPRQFVLKWNFGAGMNIICADKSKMNKDDVIRQMARWGKDKTAWLACAEMQYKYIPKKIVCEALIGADASDVKTGGGGKM